MIKLAIVDDDKVFMQRVSYLVESQADMKCIIEAASLGELFEKFDPESPPDILLLDIQLNKINSLEHLKKIKQFLPDTKTVMMTGYSSGETVLNALKNGADSYVVKGGKVTQLFEAIRDTYRHGSFLGSQAAHIVVNHIRNMSGPTTEVKIDGARWERVLTSRELEVAQELIQGKSYQEIGEQFFISINTVRQHVKALYRKLQVSNKIQLQKKLAEE